MIAALNIYEYTPVWARVETTVEARGCEFFFVGIEENIGGWDGTWKRS